MGKEQEHTYGDQEQLLWCAEETTATSLVVRVDLSNFIGMLKRPQQRRWCVEEATATSLAC